MRPAVQYRVPHLLPRVVAVDEIHRVVVEELYAPAVELARDGRQIVVQDLEERQPIPAEVRPEDHRGVGVGGGEPIGAAPDAVVRILIRPVEVFPPYPPADYAVVIHLGAPSHYMICCI